MNYVLLILKYYIMYVVITRHNMYFYIYLYLSYENIIPFAYLIDIIKTRYYKKVLFPLKCALKNKFALWRKIMIKNN